MTTGKAQPAPDEERPWGSPGDVPDMALASSVTIDDVRAAAGRIAGIAARTPAIRFARLDALVGAEVTLKCENLQPIGAFKLRGGVNAMSRLNKGQRARGVVTYSSGNHAQAIAYGASMLGIPAVIVMPVDAPRVKLEATRRLLAGAPIGSEVIEYDPAEITREELGRRLVVERGLHLIPPDAHPDGLAGQGTAALELISDAGPFDELFVCCGGGGLLAGSATVAKALNPDCRVIGVEPEVADDATRSFYSGSLQTVENPPTIADGARTPFLGRWTYPLVRRHVDGMMGVSEAQISWAMRFAYERMKIVIEPSGALGLAGLINAARCGTLGDGSKLDVSGKRVGVIISGGNVDVDALSDLFSLAGDAWPA